MIWLGIGLFFGPHLVSPFPNVRGWLIGRLGEKGYKGAYSLLALSGLVLIIMGYPRIAPMEFWPAPDWGSRLALVIMPLVFVLLAAAEQKGHIRKKLRHPMLIGVLLWATVHLVNNGDRASLYLFGSFALYSVFAMVSATRRGKVPGYETANGKHDVRAVIIGVALFSVVLWAHGFLFGVTPVF